VGVLKVEQASETISTTTAITRPSANDKLFMNVCKIEKVTLPIPNQCAICAFVASGAHKSGAKDSFAFGQILERGGESSKPAGTPKRISKMEAITDPMTKAARKIPMIADSASTVKTAAFNN